ncbi:hypothetical protein IFM89_009808 [Coptis chinensis]|uniref:Thionin-like protein n=1 Tax=Coptis chinensis TaxID=261450 RepID=A0A835I2E0_9MAGN|nr:hypothetical protein IFM89_009808 [Coptis chinensis]
MKKVTALLVMLFLLSIQVQTIEPAVTDCYDACSTGCVQRDTRLMQRCDRKCAIKCEPSALVEEVGRG